MTALNIIPVASASPTECVRCHSVKGPFVDLQIEVLGYGHIYLCVGDDEQPGCLPQMARLAGYADPNVKDGLEHRLHLAEIELAELRAKVPHLVDALAALEGISDAEKASVKALATKVDKPRRKAAAK